MAQRRSSGRIPDQRHTRITYFLQSTEAWLSLKPQERVTYLEVCRVYNGSNNGFLAVSNRVVAERCNINKDTAGLALKALVEKGFLDVVTEGGFSRKTRHATEYRLTDWRCDRTHQLPTKRYQHWRPE